MQLFTRLYISPRLHHQKNSLREVREVSGITLCTNFTLAALFIASRTQPQSCVPFQKGQVVDVPQRIGGCKRNPRI